MAFDFSSTLFRDTLWGSNVFLNEGLIANSAILICYGEFLRNLCETLAMHGYVIFRFIYSRMSRTRNEKKTILIELRVVHKSSGNIKRLKLMSCCCNFVFLSFSFSDVFCCRSVVVAGACVCMYTFDFTQHSLTRQPQPIEHSVERKKTFFFLLSAHSVLLLCACV